MVNITKIEQLIKNKGWSNTFFAEQFGRSKVWISDMKRGRSLPDENTLQTIADKLDTTVDYLTDKTEQKNKPTDNNVSELRPGTQEAIDIIQSLPDDLRDAALATLRNLAEIANKKQNP